MVLGKREIERAFSPKVNKTRPMDHASRLGGGFNRTPGEQSHMKVFIRVRPPNTKEIEGAGRNIVKIINEDVLIFDPRQDDSEFFFHGVKQSLRDIAKKKNKEMDFRFDRVYGPEENTQEVFNGSTKDIIASLLDGYNCSVFVYGATGAGKTHTMLGNEEHKGIMYLTMVDLYKQMGECKDKFSIELGISYLEVYNENVQDLLNPDKKSLHLREDTSRGVIVAGMKLEVIHNADHLFELLKKGNNNRTQHPTDANAESSRSHAIFQVYLKMMEKVSQQMKMVKLSMIDLAGSERAAANASNLMRFKEGSNINKSLLALGNCINSLADGCRHVPYRDSKLTRILKDSLGGNCKTVMIANIAPTSLSYEDTYNTLKYATRAKKIKGKLTKNIVSVEMHNAQYEKFCKQLKTENEKLIEELEKLKEQRNQQDFQNNRLNVDPQRKEMKTMYEEKQRLMTELFRLSSLKLSIHWRIHVKQIVSSYLSNIEREQIDNEGDMQDVLCLQEDVKRIEGSLSQFDGQIKSLDEKMSDLWSRQVTVTNKIINWQQTLGNLVYETLKPEIELYTSTLEVVKWRMQAEHVQKLNNMLCSSFKSHNTILLDVSKKLLDYYSLLKVFGKTDHAMKEEHKNLIKRMKGIKNVKWLDNPEEEPECVMKSYCSLDFNVFESNNAEMIASSSPISSSCNENEHNRTQTLSPADVTATPSSSVNAPPAVVLDPAPVLNATAKYLRNPSIATVNKPVINTSTNNAYNMRINKTARVPLVSSTQFTNRNPVVRTPMRPRSGVNKENMPGKINDVRNKTKFISGVPKTPRDNKLTNPYARKTPGASFDPSIGNRLKSINEKLNIRTN